MFSPNTIASRLSWSLPALSLLSACANLQRPKPIKVVAARRESPKIPTPPAAITLPPRVTKFLPSSRKPNGTPPGSLAGSDSGLK